MKILLIVPNIKSYDFMPCLSLACLKGYLKEKTDHDARIVDLQYHRKDWKQFLFDKIKDEKPDIIGFSVLSFNYPEVLLIARFIKTQVQIPLIFGGVHVILSPQEVIENKEVDIICTGEGEGVLHELLDNNLDCTHIKGIWYKKNGRIIKNPERHLIEDLDSLPFPDFDDFLLERYFLVNHHHLPIMASRGCPYSCTYCSNHALRKKLKGTYVRFRSVDNVIAEIEKRMQQYRSRGFSYLYFFDDTFILHSDFIKEFCQKFTEKGFHKHIRWTANVRANLVTDDIIRIMKEAGCYEVRMGVESGNDYIRNTIYRRNMSQEQLLKAFHIIKGHGLQLRLDFIYGAPFETVEMMNESFELAQQSQGDSVFFSRLYPFPGTEIKEVCEQEQVIEPDMKFSKNGMPGVKKTKFISEREMQRFARMISSWQMWRYLTEGFSSKGVLFLWDVFVFFIYVRFKYDLEFNQLYRWNVQEYRLEAVSS